MRVEFSCTSCYSRIWDLRKTLQVGKGFGELRSPKGGTAPFTPTKSKFSAYILGSKLSITSLLKLVE
jgi:hypothetical protein